jgi:outer membrane protein assembly factor BamB
MRHPKSGVSLSAVLMLLSVFSSSVFLSGCSWFSKKTGQEPMELVSFKKSAKLKEVWTKNVGDGQGVGFTQLTPAIDGDTIFSIDHTGLLMALSRQTGKKLWSKDVTEVSLGWKKTITQAFKEEDLNKSITGGMSAAAGLLFLGNYAGEVIAVSAVDGKEVWRKQVKGEIVSVPQTNGQVVAVQTMNGKLFVLDAKTGADLWFFESPPPVLTLRGTASPVVNDSAIYAGFANGRLMAFNSSNGLILWEQRIAMPKGRSELDRMVDIHASPVLKNGILYVGTYQGRVSALARGTGKELWGQDASTSEDIAVSEDKVFVSHSDGKVTAYNMISGELVWQNEKLLRRALSGPHIFGDYVAVIDFEGYMHLLKQSDGELAERKRVGYQLVSGKKSRNSVRAPMLTQGNTLYVFGDRGNIIAYEVSVRK